MSETEDDDKQHDPSQKRLDDARARGEIPKSADLNTAASYAGLLVISLVAGAGLLEQFGKAAMVFYRNKVAQLSDRHNIDSAI